MGLLRPKLNPNSTLKYALKKVERAVPNSEGKPNLKGRKIAKPSSRQRPTWHGRAMWHGRATQHGQVVPLLWSAGRAGSWVHGRAPCCPSVSGLVFLRFALLGARGSLDPLIFLEITFEVDLSIETR